MQKHTNVPKVFFRHPGSEGWFCPYLPFLNYFVNFMVFQHITKHVGYLFVEQGGKIHDAVPAAQAIA